MSNFPRVGETFAGYRLDGVLGRGGMSTVFRAENTRLGNIVALKVLSPELADDDQFRERFVRESRIASSINHPNIIPITDAGQDDEHLYIVMRFVDGPDLKSLLGRGGSLPTERCLDVVSQVASALDAAHAKGLLHRDVKPANVLLEPSRVDYRGDHVYLCDFGLTKHAGSTSGLTKTGHFVGTIDYMAPEQIEDGAVDARADLYALGCVTFECLTGSVPFVRGSDAAVLWAHIRDDRPMVTAHRADLPSAVDDVIARALAKSPDDRYQSARELVVELGQALSLEAPRTASKTVQARAPAVTAPAAAPALTTASASGAAPSTTLPTADALPDESHPSATSIAAAGPPEPPVPEQPHPSGDESDGRPPRGPRRQVSLLAAFGIAAAAVVLAGGGAIAGVLLSRDNSQPAAANAAGGSDTAMSGSETMSEHGASGATLEAIVPRPLFATCASMESALAGSVESVSCNPPSRADHLDIVRFRDAASRNSAYSARVKAAGISPASGTCSTTSWDAESGWEHAAHGEMKADGRVLCYFKNGNSFIAWTVASNNILAVAMKNGTDHSDLYRWWAFWHHQLA